jgi:hypothetical protein
MNLYKVTITRFVIAHDERTAQDLAVANHNPLDVEKVEQPETLSEIPDVWRTCQPYGGAPAMNVEQYLIHQIAGTPEYTEFCVQPFKVVNGNAERTSIYNPQAEFGVYARYGNGMAIHLADFQFWIQAETFKRRIERARQMQRNVVAAEDGHLEAQYEDQICGWMME